MYKLPIPGSLGDYKEKVSFLGRRSFSKSWDRPRTVKILRAGFLMAKMEGYALSWVKRTTNPNLRITSY